jgi:hypothetical protein
MTTVEAQLLRWIEDMAAYFQDGETGLAECLEKARQKHQIPVELTEWFEEVYDG